MVTDPHQNTTGKIMGQDVTILIGGKAGQGIQTIGSILAGICHYAGLFVFSVDDFESRIRGGHSFHLLRVSTRPLDAPCFEPDILVAIDENTHKIHRAGLASQGITILNKESYAGSEPGVFCVPLEALAREAGGAIAANTVAAGVVAGILGASLEAVQQVIAASFKKTKMLSVNLAAAEKGFLEGSGIEFHKRMEFEKKDNGHVVMTGARAAALGALAADCRFFPYYPMSPGTGIITSLSAFAGQLPIVLEQAEDEIAAVNMAIGASYAGVRSLVATSGGGFSLMVEGLGLSGITETPLVIINAQRPGPATGLATRTAQADLLFTIYASQDEFPRFVFAPGSVLGTFKAVKKAVMLSEKYQVPAIVLMDQFGVDSARSEPCSAFELGDEHGSFLVKEPSASGNETYERYQLTETGISLRRAPGASQPLVRVAGNEHTPMGFPSEDPQNRNAMVEKRFKKSAAMEKEMTLPQVSGGSSEFYLMGWGSSKGSIQEACNQLRAQGMDAGWIIFEELWPLDRQGLAALLDHKVLILVEGNSQGQLGTLIRSLTGQECVSKVLKYDGRPLYPEFIIQKVKQLVGK